MHKFVSYDEIRQLAGVKSQTAIHSGAKGLTFNWDGDFQIRVFRRGSQNLIPSGIFIAAPTT